MSEVIKSKHGDRAIYEVIYQGKTIGWFPTKTSAEKWLKDEASGEHDECMIYTGVCDDE